MPAVTFYFDVGSPYVYLAAERLERVIDGPVVWQPVLLGGLFRLTGRSSWALGDYRRRQSGMAEIERRARSYGLPPIRWPDPWPTDYLTAMRATTFAFSIGHGQRFAMGALRRAFRHGAELSRNAEVLRVGQELGIEPGTLEAGIRDPDVRRGLREATERAHERGVIGVPTIAVGDELFWGDDRLEHAAAHLESVAAG